MTREQAFAAIFAKLSTLTQFVTQSRRLQLVETFDVGSMPAIFQQQINEPINSQQYSLSEGSFQYSALNVSWYIYVAQSDSTAPMTPPLNSLVDAVVNLVWSGEQANIVVVGEENFALIPTSITYYEGLLGDRAVARIDVQAKPLSLP
jgi:hypothetical protein